MVRGQGQGLVNWSSKILEDKGKDKDLRLDKNDKELWSEGKDKDKDLKSEDKDKDL